METKIMTKKRDRKSVRESDTLNINYRVCIDDIKAEELVDMILSAFLDSEVGEKKYDDTKPL